MAIFELLDVLDEGTMLKRMNLRIDFERAVLEFHESKLDSSKEIFETILKKDPTDLAVKYYLTKFN